MWGSSPPENFGSLPLPRLFPSTLSIKIPSLHVTIHGAEGYPHTSGHARQIRGSAILQWPAGQSPGPKKTSVQPTPQSRYLRVPGQCRILRPADRLVRAAATASAHSVVPKVQPRVVPVLLWLLVPLAPHHPLPWQRCRRPRARNLVRKTGTQAGLA